MSLNKDVSLSFSLFEINYAAIASSYAAIAGVFKTLRSYTI